MLFGLLRDKDGNVIGSITCLGFRFTGEATNDCSPAFVIPKAPTPTRALLAESIMTYVCSPYPPAFQQMPTVRVCGWCVVSILEA